MLQKEEEMLMTGSALIITPFQGDWKKLGTMDKLEIETRKAD
jgi:hypothetical protein